MFQKRAGDTAQRPLPDAAVAVGACHDDVCVPFGRHAVEQLGVVAIGCDAVHPSGDAMSSQPTGHRIEATSSRGHVVRGRDLHDIDVARRLQQRYVT